MGEQSNLQKVLNSRNAEKVAVFSLYQGEYRHFVG